MIKRKRVIPFSWRNVLLGLVGESRAIAEAEYYYTGENLERQLAGIKSDNITEKKIAELEIDYKYNKIKSIEYEKTKATLKKEPWVKVIDINTDPKEPAAGFFEVDWNDYFILELRKSGYKGTNPEDMIDLWLKDIARNMLMATGDYFSTEVSDEDNPEDELPEGRKEYK